MINERNQQIYQMQQRGVINTNSSLFSDHRTNQSIIKFHRFKNASKNGKIGSISNQSELMKKIHQCCDDKEKLSFHANAEENRQELQESLDHENYISYRYLYGNEWNSQIAQTPKNTNKDGWKESKYFSQRSTNNRTINSYCSAVLKTQGSEQKHEPSPLESNRFDARNKQRGKKIDVTLKKQEQLSPASVKFTPLRARLKTESIIFKKA